MGRCAVLEGLEQESELLLGLLHHFPQGFLLQHIRAGKHKIYTILPGSFSGNFSTVFFEPVKDEVIAFGSKRFGNAKADATGAAGY